jgi:hypothetical protein
MRRLGALGATVAFLSLVIAGCGKNSGTVVGGGNKAQVSLTIHDNAPVGITVLSLQFQVKSALLQPGNVSISLPETVELTQLQTDTAFISSVQVPAATYTSLVLDLENPLMTFINNTGGPITPFMGSTCATGAVCTFVPAITQGNTVTFSSAPIFPLALTVAEEVGLELDVDLADLVRSDFSLNFFNTGAMSLTELASVQGAAELRKLHHALGTAGTVGVNTFAFTTVTGIPFSVIVDGNTKFLFGAACPANAFGCVKAGQVLELDLSLEGNGTLLAKEVDFETDVNVEEISGLVVALGAGSPPTSFQMLVRQASPAAATAAGTFDTITIGAGTTFSVDNHSFVLPAGLTFTTAANLLVGQEVLADVTITQVPAAAITTSTIALRRSQVTALVSTAPTPGGTTFVLNPLPSLFQTAAPTNILFLDVDTTAQTTFEFFTPDTISGVTLGGNVSVGGFLFPTGGANTATIAADAVRSQPIPGP